MGKIYNALDVAKYVINKCTVDSQPISNLQLQKILYFLQKKYLMDIGDRLFYDDIEAWQFGPVVPEAYYQYCGFGSMAIRMKYTVNLDAEDAEVIDTIVEEKRNKRPWDLVEETHAEGKAWSEVYNKGLGNRRIIPAELIKRKG